MKKLIFLLVLIISYCKEEVNWERLYKEYKDDPQKTNIEKVLASGEEALERVRENYGKQDYRYIAILEQLIDIIDTCSVFNDKKETYYIEMIESSNGLLNREYNKENLGKYLSCIHGLATFYLDSKKYMLSLELFFTKVSLIDKYYVDSLSYLKESNLISTYYQIGFVYQEQNRLPESENYYSKSFDLVIKRIENGHCQVQMEALIINSLYDILMKQSKFMEAEEMLINFDKISRISCGKNSLFYFGNLIKLKDFYTTLQNFTKADSIENVIRNIRDSVLRQRKMNKRYQKNM